MGRRWLKWNGSAAANDEELEPETMEPTEAVDSAPRVDVVMVALVELSSAGIVETWRVDEVVSERAAAVLSWRAATVPSERPAEVMAATEP
jgi:hypothetical protein